MARPLRIEFENALYHVVCRGNERKDIFRGESDYKLFLFTLKESSIFFNVIIHCHCLMTNHVHLLVETRHPNLSRFMQRLLGVYTTRFNRKYKRHGHLFQGRYKALLVDKDAYLLELSRYIHLNPCKAGMVKNPEDYPHSSMGNYLQGSSDGFPHTRFILDCFKSKKDYHHFVLEGLAGNVRNPLKDAVGGLFLGSDEFIDKFKQRLLEIQEQPYSQRKAILRLPMTKLDNFLKDKTEDFKIYCYWKIGRQTQKSIGQLFHKTDSAVSHGIKRFDKKLAGDNELLELFKQTEQNISSFKL